MELDLSKNDVKKDVHPNVKVLLLNKEFHPMAEKINYENGKGMWTIKGYRIWAKSYEEALSLLPRIQNF